MKQSYIKKLRRIKLVIYIMMFSCNLYAQNIVVANETLNILYANIDNPVALIIEGIPCEATTVNVNNGRIEKYSNCKYVIHPKFEGELIVNVFKDKQKIGSRKFRVEKLEPHLEINAFENELGTIKFDTATSLVFRYKNTGLDIDYRLFFNVLVLRSNEVIYNKHHTNRIFDENFRAVLKNLESGDVLIFQDINVIFSYSEKSERLENLCFTIP